MWKYVIAVEDCNRDHFFFEIIFSSVEFGTNFASKLIFIVIYKMHQWKTKQIGTKKNTINENRGLNFFFFSRSGWTTFSMMFYLFNTFFNLFYHKNWSHLLSSSFIDYIFIIQLRAWILTFYTAQIQEREKINSAISIASLSNATK